MSVYEYVPTRHVRRLKKRVDARAEEMRAQGYELLPVHLQRYITALGALFRLAETGVKFEMSAGRERARLVKEKWVSCEALRAALVLERLEQEKLRELVGGPRVLARVANTLIVDETHKYTIAKPGDGPCVPVVGDRFVLDCTVETDETEKG